jgi:two-component system KDP operon response regulator KdpE
MTVNDDRPRVLVADDDPSMRLLLRRTLELANFHVTLARDGQETLTLLQRAAPTLLILDIMMPGMDGLDVCRRVRAQSALPIILLTALNSEEDIIHGLDAGADDYLTKPFATGELLARVRAAVRRARLNAEPPAPPVRTGDLSIDLTQRTVALKGQFVELTPTERRLLLVLARHIGRVLTTEQLLTQVWGPGYSNDVRLVQVNISRLRLKVEPDRDKPTYIHTLPGVGYLLARHPAVEPAIARTS